MITASQLQGAPVRNRSGEKLGHVRELHVRDGEVTTLVVGAGGILQRFWRSRGGRRIAWSKVAGFGPDGVVVED